MRQLAGLWLTYTPDGVAANPQSARLHAVLGKQFGFSQGPGMLWQGNLADMDGMQIVLQNDLGILKDRTGHVLWTGPLGGQREPPAYTVVTDRAKPGFLTLLDKQGKTLWSGAVIAEGLPVRTLDGYIAVVGPAGRIVWQQPAAPGRTDYRSLDHGGLLRHNGFDREMFNGTVNLAAVPRRAVFRTPDGHVFYSGPLLTLLIRPENDKSEKDMLSPQERFFPFPTVIFPFGTPGYRGGMRCDLYDPAGKVIQTITMQAH